MVAAAMTAPMCTRTESPHTSPTDMQAGRERPPRDEGGVADRIRGGGRSRPACALITDFGRLKTPASVVQHHCAACCKHLRVLALGASRFC